MTLPQPRHTLQPPRAPPDHLRLQSFQILSRLELIQSFHPWLDLIRRSSHHLSGSASPKSHQYTPLELLWTCFSLGTPQCTLLNLLGSPSPRHLAQSSHFMEGSKLFELTIEEREVYFTSFIQRVQMLEVQGRVPYGEVLRSEDFLSTSNAAFAKVLRTIYRLLFALEEIYPGLFVLPSGSHERRKELIQELIDTERSHLSRLETIFEAAATLVQSETNEHPTTNNVVTVSSEPCLESLLVNRTQLLEYHRQLLKSMAECFSKSVEMPWTRMFAFDDDLVRTSVFGTYRSICINYLSLVGFLEAINVDHEPSGTRTLREHVSTVLSRISDYTMILQDILEATQPSDNYSAYNSLCEAVFRMQDVSETMNEAGRQLRTIHSSAQALADRMYTWTTLPDADELGVLLLDDRVRVLVDEGSEKSVTCSVVLFERMFFCFQEGFERRQAKHSIPPSYPIYAWELGPALRGSCPLDVAHAIPVSELVSVSCPDTSSIEITWQDVKQKIHNITLLGMVFNQWDQWLTTFEPFVPPFTRPPPIVPHLTFGDEEISSTILSEDEDESGRMLTHAKSWSVIARKGPRSETSSFVNLKNEDELLISPGLLPTLFSTHFEILRSPSPLILSHVEQSVDVPLSQSEVKTGSSLNSLDLVDLTGKITKEGRYASAHGGFSDVWKGVWQDGDYERKVAIKVVRTVIDEPETEAKLVRRLHRELEIWKTLNHPHVLTLYGATFDFGRYASMVCPWMENGSLSKYIERCGDILSIPERLKILCEVADGLSYLHSRSVVHGDLTGSNILLDEDGHARLCDFGLSSIVAGFQTLAGVTSTIGGAVRWADPLLYRAQAEDGPVVVPGTENDIYSFGSVMLEILSGRIPYHYIKTDVQVVIELHRGNKPRRPAQSFVSDQQWHLIEQCWNDDPGERPRIGKVATTMQALHSTSLSKRL